MRIGVLAVQGAFAEHVATLGAIGVEGVEVRLPSDLAGLSGLILPGGELTAQRRLIDRWGLRQPILDLAESGVPLFGTCAGMILLAERIVDDDEPVFPLLDIDVRRNAFGRQLDSFEADITVPMLGDRPVHAVFIRAPIVERCRGRRRRPRPTRRRPDRRGLDSATSSPRRSTPSSPARRAFIDSWLPWRPSTTTRARVPGAATTRRGGRGRPDDFPPTRSLQRKGACGPDHGPGCPR